MTPWGPMGQGVTLPAVNMGYEDGLALRELIGTGKPVNCGSSRRRSSCQPEEHERVGHSAGRDG
jgi:hypothetical protein